MLQVTPNGPWGKDVHPNLPVSLDELLTDLRDCFRAGATGVHRHVRTQSGPDAGTVDGQRMWDAIEERVSPAELRTVVANITETVPAAGSDPGGEWRAALVERYAVMRPFLPMLCTAVESVLPPRPPRCSRPTSSGSRPTCAGTSPSTGTTHSSCPRPPVAGANCATPTPATTTTLCDPAVGSPPEHEAG
ncbi:MAG: hypothetical protein DLM59_04270 [Pseudonocardiales bacterium]|nr:MAG: hypothetical protein DLM59_04270 [Pseudonocardiales bacterium]